MAKPDPDDLKRRIPPPRLNPDAAKRIEKEADEREAERLKREQGEEPNGS